MSSYWLYFVMYVSYDLSLCVFSHWLLFYVGLSSWSHSRHHFVIKGSINKPVIHTHVHLHAHGSPSRGQTGRYFRWFQSEIEKKQQETVHAKLSWKQTQVHCNYNTARPNCGLHSHKYSVTARTNRPSAFSNHTAIGRGQSRAILAIAADTTQSWRAGNLCDIDSRYMNLILFENERLHRASELNNPICVLTALDSACLQISHLPSSEHSWLELFPRDLQHF